MGHLVLSRDPLINLEKFIGPNVPLSCGMARIIICMIGSLGAAALVGYAIPITLPAFLGYQGYKHYKYLTIPKCRQASTKEMQ